MVMMVFLFVEILLLVFAFHFLNPSGGCGHFHEVEHPRVQNLLERHVAIVAIYNLGFGLEGVNYLTDAAQFARLHFCSLVQQYDVAELNLLYHQVLNVLIAYVLLQQVHARAELVFHAQGVHHGHDAVKHGNAVGIISLRILNLGNRADGLGDWCRLADATCLYHDIIEFLHGNQVA